MSRAAGDIAVSSLVTVYNREQILRSTFNSLLASSFQNQEIILVDDRSGDNSWAICLQLQSESQNIPIRAFRNDSNLGDYANRNRAASLAQGRYLKYLDADDLIYPHSLQVMVDAMEQFPDAAVAECDRTCGVRPVKTGSVGDWPSCNAMRV